MLLCCTVAGEHISQKKPALPSQILPPFLMHLNGWGAMLVAWTEPVSWHPGDEPILWREWKQYPSAAAHLLPATNELNVLVKQWRTVINGLTWHLTLYQKHVSRKCSASFSITVAVKLAYCKHTQTHTPSEQNRFVSWHAAIVVELDWICN